MLAIRQCLTMHGETPAEDDYFLREGALDRGGFLPAMGHMVDVFADIQLNPGDPGFPLAEVEVINWSIDLDAVELHLHCDVLNGFWYDRPWRQHLKQTGWRMLDENGDPVSS